MCYLTFTQTSFTKRYFILFPLIFLNIELKRNNKNKKKIKKKDDIDITFLGNANHGFWDIG